MALTLVSYVPSVETPGCLVSSADRAEVQPHATRRTGNVKQT